MENNRLQIMYNKKPSYEIVMEDSFFDLVKELDALSIENRKICIITDSTVGKLYGDEVLKLLDGHCKEAHLFTMKAGEENKNLDTVKSAYVFLIEHGFDRKDLLIALGGGVVGDLTGFVAATYLRGVDFVQVPTTLLAFSDSSIGGKTGVDFDGYKNMVGAFKMPKLVYMNISVLSTLEDRQFFSGFAEVMKYGLIKDEAFYLYLIENLYEICEKEPEVLKYIIYRSCEIKKQVVEKDPTELGDRALLNFGHTIGHAIEKHMKFSLYHGECVALGSVCAAFISYKKGMISHEEYLEVRDMFVPFNLPITIENIEPKQILKLTRSDKKMEAGKLKFILLKGIGKAVIDTTVTEDEILEAINEIYYDEEAKHE